MHTELVLANETVLRPGSSSQVVGAAVAVGRRAWEERRVDVGRAHGSAAKGVVCQCGGRRREQAAAGLVAGLVVTTRARAAPGTATG